MNKALHESKNCGYLYDGKSSHGLSARWAKKLKFWNLPVFWALLCQKQQ